MNVRVDESRHENPMSAIHDCDAGSEDEWRSFLEDHPFGELIACGRDRDVAVVVPTQFVLDGDDVLVHLVKANPIWAALEENPHVVLSVSGDWAYIPSSWKVVGGMVASQTVVNSSVGFAKTVRVNKGGFFRALVLPVEGAHVSGYSPTAVVKIK